MRFFWGPLRIGLASGDCPWGHPPDTPPLLPQILPTNGLATWSVVSPPGSACGSFHLWIRLWICWDSSSRYLGRLWISQASRLWGHLLLELGRLWKSQVSVSGGHFCNAFEDPLELALLRGIPLGATPPRHVPAPPPNSTHQWSRYLVRAGP